MVEVTTMESTESPHFRLWNDLLVIACAFMQRFDSEQRDRYRFACALRVRRSLAERATPR